MKMRKALALLAILALLLSGCGVNYDEAMQQCLDAVTALESQSEFHFTSTTLIGQNLEQMERNSTVEYWISGDDWLSVQPLYGSETLWKLSYDGNYAYGATEKGMPQWQFAEEQPGEEKPVSPIPDLSGIIFKVKKVDTVEGNQVITLISDDQVDSEGAYGNGTLSDYQVIFVFREDGTLAQYKFSFCSAFPGADGTVSEAIYQQILEYCVHPQGEIADYLLTQFQNAD